MAGIDASKSKCFQYRPGAINVIAPPASEPGAAWFLLPEQVGQSTLHDFPVPVLSVQSQKTRAARGNVAGWGIKQGTVIGKRNFVEIIVGIIAIKSGKTSVGGLHSGKPIRRSGNIFAISLRVCLMKRPGDGSGIVEVRVVWISIL